MTVEYIINCIPAIWIGIGILTYIIGIIVMIATCNMKDMTWGAVPLGLVIFMMIGPVGFVVVIIGMFKRNDEHVNDSI